MYSEIATRLDTIIKNRKEIESLHFHNINDPRLVAVYTQIAELMHIQNPMQDRVSVKLKTVGREAAQQSPFQAVTSFDDDAVGQIYLDSASVLGILRMEGSNYILGCNALANEVCHRLRGEQYGNREKYLEAYENEWPENSITSNGLPSEVVDYYDGWYAEHYSAKIGTAREKLEKESFYVAYLSAENLIQNGITVKLDKESAAAIHWTNTGVR